MSWQAFSWHEIRLQAKDSRFAERMQPALQWTGAASQEVVAFLSAFLTPLALMEAALGVWRLGSDLGWAGDFCIAEGLLSHWQVWFAMAALTQAASVNLTRQLKKHAEGAEKQK